MTDKQFSFASFAEFGNKEVNTQGTKLNIACTAFVENTMNDIGKRYGYPTNREELHECLGKYDGYDVSGITDVIPSVVSGFMHDTQRAFDLPAPDDNTCPATIKVVAKDKEVKEGVLQFGARKDETYKTTVAAHEEVVVKNKRDKFKK